MDFFDQDLNYYNKGVKLISEDANYTEEQKEALQELQKHFEYWSKKILIFNEQTRLEKASVEIRKPLPKKSLIIFIILLAIWIIPVTVFLSLLIFYAAYWGNIPWFFLFLFILIVLVAPSFIPLIYRIKKSKEREEEKLHIGNDQVYLSEKLDKLYKEYCVKNKCSLPRKYINPDYIKKLADYINLGQANNIKEALNLIEKEDI